MIVFPLTFSFLEITLIILVIVLLIGGRRIPDLMRGIGRGVRNFKNAAENDVDDQPNQAEIEDRK